MATVSMTGFGEGRAEREDIEVIVELRSVNHRFLDVSSKLPGVYSRFESELSKLIRSRIKRGRVECYVGRKDRGEPEYDIQFNRTLFKSFLDVLKGAFKDAALTKRDDLGSAVVYILSKREVLELIPKERNEEGELVLVKEALSQALAGLMQMRNVEGAELESEMLGLVTKLDEIVAEIDVLAERTPIDHKARLEQRLSKLGDISEIDPERLAQEIALFADKVDTTEEIARLKSHILQSRDIIKNGEGGRKFEFLLQELGREVNTIGSKSQNSEITTLVIESKAILEKLREQVQNIE